MLHFQAFPFSMATKRIRERFSLASLKFYKSTRQPLSDCWNAHKAAGKTTSSKSQLQLRKAGAQQVYPEFQTQDSKQLVPIHIQCFFLKQQTQHCIN